jgi:cytochrome c oxidase assembly protein subunit 15
MDEITLARIHGCVGPLFFISCVAAAVVTSRYWDQAPSVSVDRARPFKRLALITTLIAFLQLVIGAHLRHLPAHWSFNVVQVLVAAHLIVALVLLVHGGWLACRCCRDSVLRSNGLLRRPSLLLAALMIFQLTLGVATWIVKYAWPTWLPELAFFNSYTVQAESMMQASIVTAHVAVGSLILAVAMVLSLRSLRLMSNSNKAVVATSCSRGVTELVV